MRASVAFVLIAAFVGACQSDGDEDPGEQLPDSEVTYYRDVAPMLSKHCMTCHQDGGIGPFSMQNYDDARQWAKKMVTEIDAGRMPPFDAREEASCTPRFGWVDDPRLTLAEKALLKKWIELDYPAGLEAPIPDPPVTTLAKVDQTIAPATGHATSGDRDQFVCYVLDPQAASFKWLTGLQVRPDVSEVVHHAVITELAPGAEQDALVADKGIGQPFMCDATPGGFVVHIWTPGNQPMQTDGKIAVPIQAGAKLVMQIHYHPAGQTHRPDKTAVDLTYSDTWPERMYFVAAFGNAFQAPELLAGPGDNGAPRFFIPKNAADHSEAMEFTIPNLGGLEDVRLFSVNPHMHLVGTHIESTIVRPAPRGSDPATECLANGAWNFDWQRTYTYATPLDRLPSIAAGDKLRVSCKWNNTLDNPFVQRMLKDSNLPPNSPIDITLGEQTTNEMCLEIFGFAIPAPAQAKVAQDPASVFPAGLRALSRR